MEAKQTGSDTIILEMDGPQITATKFRRGLNAFLDIVDEVVKDISGSKKSIRWIVNLRSGSLQVLLRAESASKRMPDYQIPSTLETIQMGVRTIEKGPNRPPHFNDEALSKSRELASIVNGKRRELDTIRIRLNGQTDYVTTKTVANIDSLFGTATKAWGSVEGRLSVISEKGGLNIAVYDDVSERYVRCNVPEKILGEVLAAYRKRVRVSGLIRYYHTGDIKDITVEEFDMFPDPKSLPDFEDLFGMFREAE